MSAKRGELFWALALGALIWTPVVASFAYAQSHTEELRIDAAVRASPVEPLRITLGVQGRLRSDVVTRILPDLQVDVRVLPFMRLVADYTYLWRIAGNGAAEQGHRVAGGLSLSGRVDDFEFSFRSLVQWRLMTDTHGARVGDNTATYARNRASVAYRLGGGRSVSLGAEHFLQVLDVVQHNRVRLALGFTQRLDEVDLDVGLSCDLRDTQVVSTFLTLGVRWAPEALQPSRGHDE